MNIKSATITHELHTKTEKKNLAKLADREFKVKLTFKDGIYDDEALVEGYPEDVSNFIGHFKIMKHRLAKPKSLTRRFAGLDA